MPYYPDDVVNEVFMQNDIVDYVSRFVKLKRVGRDYSGLCPFHKEKSPSFHVSGEKQLFHCFGCGAGGDLVQFVMRAEGLDFVEALKLLAERAGIELPEAGQASDESQQIRKKTYEMNKIAARFFYDTLTKTESGKIALAYFNERKISKASITAYGLGFAPDGYTSLLEHLLKKGYTKEEALLSGLCIEREGKIYDKFRNRIMFPIIDLRGNVIGFSGRIMGSGETASGFKLPKYLNSAETAVFNKGKNLYSLNIAKKTNPFSIILVEGNIDVVSVYQAGISNVVATLGTALTENQAKLLLKYCNEILICYDTDEPGQKAAIRAIEVINSVGGRSRVIKLKDAKDPDEYIKKKGASSFLKAVSDAVASTQYRLDILRTQYNLDSPEGKAMFVSEACDALKTISDAVEVDAYINKIATETQVNRDAIISEYRKKMAKQSNEENEYEKRAVANQKNSPSALTLENEATKKLVNSEKKLIFLMAQNKKYIDIVKENFEAEEFCSEIHKKLARIIFEARDNNTLIEPSIILNEFTGSDINYVSDIFYNLEEYKDNNKTLEELIKNIKLEKIEEQIRGETDTQKISELVLQRQRLITGISD